ncbi:MAG: efflux RND transporter permease subunit, partial [Alphaproteobacteria bacterium]|nr:efflux RND transporter permease subunit [Alphaproteobacteria bacterium]
ALTKLNRQFFPDFGIDVIQVSVTWPGATAEDVEASIVEALEPEVRFLDGVDQTTGVASEGFGAVVIEFQQGADMQRALSEVESAVAQITTFPEDSERPTVRQVVRYDTIARLILSGPFDEAVLKRHAKVFRDDLLARGIDRVLFLGARDEEIRVELAPETLRRLDLTLDDVAAAIGRSSQDVPAGDIKGSFERQPRALGLARTADDIQAIEVRSTPSGQKIMVGDIAEVVDGFDDDGVEARRVGHPAIELEIQRALTSDALDVADRLDAYLADLPKSLPAGLEVESYDILANLIRDRINLLLRNGLGGLVLVIAILFLFLNSRVAFWIAAGIPISLMAMLAVLWLNGQTINMISLFAMLLAIGIVVDDAIVVGEHAAALRESGLDPTLAAENGVLRMVAPVTSASLTTIASFLPIFIIGGIIGTIIREVPLVVIAVLIASLVECFFVLPFHMRGALREQSRPSRLRERFNRGFEHFRDVIFRRWIEQVLAWRYAVAAAAIGALILSVGLIMGGRVGFVFFSMPETDTIEVNVSLAPGSDRVATEAALLEIDAALKETALAYVDDPDDLIVMSFVRIGSNLNRQPGSQQITGDNIGSMHVELISADLRPVRIDVFIEAWRQAIPALAGIETLILKERAGGPPGRELDIRLRGGSSLDGLKQASLELQALLARLPGVSQIDDDLPYGKEEVLVELTPRGRALGFTTESVGRQLRDALEGRIAKRFPRADEEVEVIVSLSSDSAARFGLSDFVLRSPGGQEVLLGEVATLNDDRGYARIQREDGVRRTAITAELDEAVIKQEQVIEALEEGGITEIARRHGLDYRFAGKAEEQAETLADIRIGGMLALALIYIILAWVFASFTRPFAVMLVIPFGLIGAVLGHMLMGYNLSILSIIALLGLAGILVNDSIILVTAIDRRRRDGMTLEQAIADGTCSRLRAVILTSATTIGGLTPLMFEASLQARFLIPMGITIVFGLMVTTFVVLFLVPAVIGIQTDIGVLTSRWLGRREARAA